MSSRFHVIDNEEVQDFKSKKVAKSTSDATNFGMNLLKCYLTETNADIEWDLRSVSKVDLNDILVRFYIGCRTKKGELYKLNSMRSVRFSLQRYFLEFSIDIIQNQEFVEANIVFENVLKKIKESGKGETDHHREIEPEDVAKLYKNFNIYNPCGLQEKVWFDIMFFFIRRGRENQRKMTKNTFKIATDASGKRFIYQVDGETDKNHSIHDKTFETPGEGSIYETGDDKCPVKCFQLYLSRLHPDLDALWQRPNNNVHIMDVVWYCNAPHGEKYLGNMLSRLSKKYRLSQMYTNHCLRVTSLQTLDDNNIEGRHIIRVSGHKNVESVQNYARTLSAARKRKISSVLSERCQPSSSSSTCPSISPVIQPQSSIATAPLPVDFFTNEVDASDDYLSAIPTNLLSTNNEVNASDDDLSAIPTNLLSTNNENASGSFPVFNNCSNFQVHFHIHK